MKSVFKKNYHQVNLKHVIQAKKKLNNINKGYLIRHSIISSGSLVLGLQFLDPRSQGPGSPI